MYVCLGQWALKTKGTWMVRRTKDEALATRSQLLDAAERVFAQKGVSRTSLSDIAAAAGTTRGAIYWHFKNKADVFNAMMDRVILPMEAAFEQMGQLEAADPVAELQQATLTALRQIAQDERIRHVFEVATHKVEYVDEQLAIKERHLRAYTNCVRATQRSLEDIARRRDRPLPVPSDVASNGLHAMMSGLIQSWLMDPKAFDLVVTAEHSVTTYLSGLGLIAQSRDAA
jgi:TetR/AcrR family acrAB operon transcriptional repressor